MTYFSFRFPDETSASPSGYIAATVSSPAVVRSLAVASGYRVLDSSDFKKIGRLTFSIGVSRIDTLRVIALDRMLIFT